jgi:hypothetical protein
MELALNEAKIQAKKLCKAVKADPNILTKLKISLKSIQVVSASDIQLKHCQLIISRQLVLKIGIMLKSFSQVNNR